LPDYKDYKNSTKLPKELAAKIAATSAAKTFCFKTKAAKIARICSSQSQLSLARQAEITFSRYELTLFEG